MSTVAYNVEEISVMVLSLMVLRTLGNSGFDTHVTQGFRCPRFACLWAHFAPYHYINTFIRRCTQSEDNPNVWALFLLEDGVLQNTEVEYIWECSINCCMWMTGLRWDASLHRSHFHEQTYSSLHDPNPPTNLKTLRWPRRIFGLPWGRESAVKWVFISVQERKLLRTLKPNFISDLGGVCCRSDFKVYRVVLSPIETRFFDKFGRWNLR
jgi:hypothetical protein